MSIPMGCPLISLSTQQGPLKIGVSILQGTVYCGAVKKVDFFYSPIFVDFCRPKGCFSTPDGKNVKNGLKNVGKM